MSNRWEFFLQVISLWISLWTFQIHTRGILVNQLCTVPMVLIRWFYILHFWQIDVIVSLRSHRQDWYGVCVFRPMSPMSLMGWYTKLWLKLRLKHLRTCHNILKKNTLLNYVQILRWNLLKTPSQTKCKCTFCYWETYDRYESKYKNQPIHQVYSKVYSR